jgi:hypothetical protein
MRYTLLYLNTANVHLPKGDIMFKEGDLAICKHDGNYSVTNAGVVCLVVKVDIPQMRLRPIRILPTSTQKYRQAIEDAIADKDSYAVPIEHFTKYPFKFQTTRRQYDNQN